MELDNRLEKVEHELAVLKGDLRGVLLNIQRNLAEKPAASSRWEKKAWGLALLNTLLALTLFTNLRLYTSDSLTGISPSLAPWLRAAWATMALVWLLLQMYPLVLVLSQRDKASRAASWRSTVAFCASNPGMTIAVASSVLIVAIVSLILPPLWFAVAVVLLAVGCVHAAVRILRSRRRQP